MWREHAGRPSDPGASAWRGDRTVGDTEGSGGGGGDRSDTKFSFVGIGAHDLHRGGLLVLPLDLVPALEDVEVVGALPLHALVVGALVLPTQGQQRSINIFSWQYSQSLHMNRNLLSQDLCSSTNTPI